MSTARGSTNRKRAQKHQNRSAFKNDLHDTSHRTKLLNSLDITGVCKRCKDILDWKIKYKKYKPLSAPRKCVDCEQKSVKYAYHMLCSKCATAKKVCAKCCKAVENESSAEDPQDQNVMNAADITSMLTELSERKRRTVLRYINKQKEGNQKITPEIQAKIENLLAQVENMSFDDDSLFDDDDLQSDSEVEEDNQDNHKKTPEI